MKRLLLAALVLSVGAADSPARAGQLESIARTASVMVDGDVCQRIVTTRAAKYLLKTLTGDPGWEAGDNYDVDGASFLLTKKTLMRLSRLADFPVDVNLWLPVTPDHAFIHIAIRNRYEMSQFWPWGKLTQETPAVMRTVLREGKPVTVPGKDGFLSVLAPVRNSLDEIVGLVEVATKTPVDARENVK